MILIHGIPDTNVAMGIYDVSQLDHVVTEALSLLYPTSRGNIKTTWAIACYCCLSIVSHVFSCKCRVLEIYRHVYPCISFYVSSNMIAKWQDQHTSISRMNTDLPLVYTKFFPFGSLPSLIPSPRLVWGRGASVYSIDIHTHESGCYPMHPCPQQMTL